MLTLLLLMIMKDQKDQKDPISKEVLPHVSQEVVRSQLVRLELVVNQLLLRSQSANSTNKTSHLFKSLLVLLVLYYNSR